MRGRDWIASEGPSHNSYSRADILEKPMCFDPKDCCESVWVTVCEQLTWEACLVGNNQTGLAISHPGSFQQDFIPTGLDSSHLL